MNESAVDWRQYWIQCRASVALKYGAEPTFTLKACKRTPKSQNSIQNQSRFLQRSRLREVCVCGGWRRGGGGRQGVGLREEEEGEEEVVVVARGGGCVVVVRWWWRWFRSVHSTHWSIQARSGWVDARHLRGQTPNRCRHKRPRPDGGTPESAKRR